MNYRKKKVGKGGWRMPRLTEAMKDVTQMAVDPRISEWDNPAVGRTVITIFEW